MCLKGSGWPPKIRCVPKKFCLHLKGQAESLLDKREGFLCSFTPQQEHLPPLLVSPLAGDLMASSAQSSWNLLAGAELP